MKISIIHPSRKRPNLAFQTARHWLNNAKNSVEYIISIDDDDDWNTYMNYTETLKSEIESKRHKIGIHIAKNDSSVEAINKVAKIVNGDLLIVVSDDFECFPEWDEWLITRLQGYTDFVVKTTDTLQEWLITLPIMDRTYYNRFGYIYYPGYKHLFSDTEMTEVGHLLGKVIDLRDKDHVFLHKHPCGGFVERDETYLKNDETWNQGETLFYERKSNNFYL